MLNKNLKLKQSIIEQANSAYNVIIEKQNELSNLGFEVSGNIQASIVINKGRIVPVTDPKDQEEIDKLYREIGRHIGRINELAAENEQLREELAALKQTKEEQNNIIVKEADAVEQPKVTPVVETKDKVAEEHAKYATRKPNPKKEPVIIDERKRNGFAEGRISLDNKTYLEFTASNRFDKVVVHGVTDDEQLRAAKELIINQGYGDIFTGYASTVDELLYAEDKENKIVAYCEQGVFYGHIDNKYYFVWDPAWEGTRVDAPVGCLITNMKKPGRKLRAMNHSWGAGFVKRAEDIKALCATMKYVDLNRLIKEEEMGVCSTSSSVTNEIVVDTKDVVSKTNDSIQMTEDEAADVL